MKKSYFIIIIIAIGVIGGLLASGVWSPFVAQKNLNKAIGKLAEISLFKAEGNGWVEMIFPKEDGKEKSQNIKLSLDFESLFDIKNEKSDSEINFNLEGLDPLSLLMGSVALGEESGMEFKLSLGAQVKSKENELYIKLTKLPALLSDLASNISDQWIKTDLKKISQETTEEKIKIPEEKEKELLAKIFEKIKELLKKKPILKVKKILAGERIDGMSCFHYLVNLDKDSIKEMIIESAKIAKDYLPAEEKAAYEKALEENLNDFSKKYDEFVQKIGEINFEVWIGKDFFIRKIKGEKEIDSEKLKDLLEGTKAEEIKEFKAKIKLGIESKFSDFNKEVKIEMPEDYKDYEELFPAATSTPSE